MSKILEADDLKIGDYVTILQGKITSKTVPTLQGPKEERTQDTMYNGTVLKIVAIDLPYVILKMIGYSPKSFDIREVKIGTVSTEYISGMYPNFDPTTFSEK
jgi:hypothetical protein